MARSGHEGCGCGVRPVEALRRSADAVLSEQHAGQPRGERRRGMLRTRGPRPDSKSTFLVAGKEQAHRRTRHFDESFCLSSPVASAGLKRSPDTGIGAIFDGVSLIRIRLGIRSKCFRLFVISVIEWRMAHDAIQRSFGATTTPAG